MIFRILGTMHLKPTKLLFIRLLFVDALVRHLAHRIVCQVLQKIQNTNKNSIKVMEAIILPKVPFLPNKHRSQCYNIQKYYRDMAGLVKVLFLF